MIQLFANLALIDLTPTIHKIPVIYPFLQALDVNEVFAFTRSDQWI